MNNISNDGGIALNVQYTENSSKYNYKLTAIFTNRINSIIIKTIDGLFGISILVGKKPNLEYPQNVLEELMKYIGINMMCLDFWFLKLFVLTTACQVIKTFLADLQLVNSNMAS
jgi:hypothetical protein